MTPEKDESKSSPRPESVRSRLWPKIIREAEAKTYEAEAEATLYNVSCNI